VQVLAKSGYDSYLFCRPNQGDCKLPADAFEWVGYDGSIVTGRRVQEFYNSRRGRAREKIEGILSKTPNGPTGIVLWGVGNHGGGASRHDLRSLGELIGERSDVRIQHSTPESYFADLRRTGGKLPRHSKDINPWAVGCYTSQVRIKQKHRRLENELYSTEKMLVAAMLQGLVKYPGEELHEAQADLLTGEFHDILPGSSIQPVEEAALRGMDHGLEILSRLKARAFFALAQGQPRAREEEIPVLVYNPHPHPVRAIVECEMNLADSQWDGKFTNVRTFAGKRELVCQVEKELSCVSIDWRKRVVFEAELAPSQMNRFDCRLERMDCKPAPTLKPKGNAIRFRTGDLVATVSTRTGFLESYRVGGVEMLRGAAFQPLVIEDYEDPWGMLVRAFPKVAGEFRLMNAAQSRRFSAVKKALPAVRIIEDGAVRTVVEAVFAHGDSSLSLRYKLPKHGTEIEVEARVYWNEKDRMLKLAIPTRLRDAGYLGQVAYGRGELPANGDEAVAHKWVAAVSKRSRRAITVINDGTYGSSFSDGEIRLTLLRSPAYSGHPIGDREIVPQDRATPRIDQGERVFRFRMNAGSANHRLDAIDREALSAAELPMALSFFPCGAGDVLKPTVVVEGEGVLITAMKHAGRGPGVVVRLFEPTGRARTVRLRLPGLGMKIPVKIGAFEIKTLRIDPRKRRVVEADLLERPLRRK
jgi:alpha-mannosidase